MSNTISSFQLALPVLFQSGIQNLAETPEGMSHMPEYVKDLLREIFATWDETKFVDGFPGEFVILARRSGKTWYIAGINGGG